MNCNACVYVYICGLCWHLFTSFLSYLEAWVSDSGGQRAVPLWAVWGHLLLWDQRCWKRRCWAIHMCSYKLWRRSHLWNFTYCKRWLWRNMIHFHKLECATHVERVEDRGVNQTLNGTWKQSWSIYLRFCVVVEALNTFCLHDLCRNTKRRAFVRVTTCLKNTGRNTITSVCWGLPRHSKFITKIFIHILISSFISHTYYNGCNDHFLTKAWVNALKICVLT